LYLVAASRAVMVGCQSSARVAWWGFWAWDGWLCRVTAERMHLGLLSSLWKHWALAWAKVQQMGQPWDQELDPLEQVQAFVLERV
jgi:hypothetical protein